MLPDALSQRVRPHTELHRQHARLELIADRQSDNNALWHLKGSARV